MIISGLNIKKRLGKSIIIDPYDEKKLNPNSYNLTLADEIMVYNGTILDMKKCNDSILCKIPKEGILLQPNTLYLCRTVEHTETYDLVPMIEGRSSIGRLGLFVHITAGFGDVGFKGHWTLELSCIQPIRIYAGVEICQIFYHTIEGEYENYKGKYNTLQSSKIHLEFNRVS